jgi:hypothetical protein
VSVTDYDTHWITSSGGGGGTTWGTISGTLSSQTDLNTALGGKSDVGHDHAWSDVKDSPTTLAGYGITDPVVLTSGSYADPAWITSLAWSKIASKPTTLAGYGITDPVVLTSGSYADPAWITSINWSKVTSRPTTLAGYGITDAVPTTRTVSTQHSLTGGGDLSANRTLNLVGDVASPGASKMYGTNSSGTRGWYDQPSGGGGGGNPEGWNVIVSTENFDVENATVQPHPELQFPILAGQSYLVQMVVVNSGNNTTGDCSWRFAVDAGVMSGEGTMQSLNASITINHLRVFATAGAVTGTIIIGTHADLTIPLATTITYSFTATADGTFIYQFGVASAAAGRIARVWKGSILRWKQLS